MKLYLEGVLSPDDPLGVYKPPDNPLGVYGVFTLALVDLSGDGLDP